MNINELTASRIKELRLKSGLTVEAVAHDLNISKSAFSQMENGHVEITLNRIQALAQIFNVSVSEIIRSTNTPQTFSGNNNVNGNGNNNTTTTLNNFFANNEESLAAVMELIKAALKGDKKTS